MSVFSSKFETDRHDSDISLLHENLLGMMSDRLIALQSDMATSKIGTGIRVIIVLNRIN